MSDSRERLIALGTSFGGAMAHSRIRDELAKVDLAGMGRKMDDAADALRYMWQGLVQIPRWVALSGRFSDWELDSVSADVAYFPPEGPKMPRKARTPNCHPDRRHLAQGLCKPCYDEAYARAHRSEMTAKSIEWSARNPDRVKNARRKYRYGIDNAEFTRRLEIQDGLCAVCRLVPGTDIDHDHKNDQVRGILCGDCNRALGLFRDNVAILVRAAAYIHAWDGRATRSRFDRGRFRSSERKVTTMASREIVELAESPNEPEGFRVFTCACGCGQLCKVTYAEFSVVQDRAKKARDYPVNTWYVTKHAYVTRDDAMRCCTPYLGSVKIRA